MRDASGDGADGRVRPVDADPKRAAAEIRPHQMYKGGQGEGKCLVYKDGDFVPDFVDRGPRFVVYL